MRTSIEVAKYIESLLEKRNIKASDLAKRTDLDKSTISRYFKGERKIPMDEIPKFANALGISPVELLVSNDTAVNNYTEVIDDFVQLGLYGEVYCGEGEVNFGYPLTVIETPASWINGGEYFYLEAVGDSMIGAKVHEGDLLLIRKQDVVDNGEIAVVVAGDKRMLKRVYKSNDKITLYSENPKYEPIEYDPQFDGNIRIIGKLKKAITSFN